MPDAATDRLSTLAREIIKAATYEKLAVNGGAPVKARQMLDGVAPEQLLTAPVKSKEHADAMLGGLWLWHDALDECHRIVQDIASPTGSFWHAIMHRREGDFSNSKYWYRRCASHQVVRMMGSVASSLAGEHLPDRLVGGAIGSGWGSGGFVDLVAAVHNKPADPRRVIAIRFQQAEWQALFEYCACEATGAEVSNLDVWDRRVTQ